MKRTYTGPRLEPSRVLFSIGLPQYRELRAVIGNNPNDYVGIVFAPRSGEQLPRLGPQT